MTLDEDTRKNNVDSIRTLYPLLTQKESEQLKTLINEKLVALPGASPLGGANPEPVPQAWAMVIKELYEICADEPQRLNDVLMAFYTNYANCFSYHDMKDLEYYRFVEEIMTRREDSRERILPSHTVQDQYVTNMVHDMLAWHQELHEKLTCTYEFQGKVEVETLIEQELLPMLNTQIVFTLEDTALGENKTLADSIYAKELKLPERKTLRGNINVYTTEDFYDYSKAEAPMRFLLSKDGGYATVDEPVFYPKSWFGVDGSFFLQSRKAHFYPYNDGFLPKIRENSNVIFTCTIYHYLMMGAPRAIRFHDMAGKADDQDIPFTLSDPGPDGVIRVNVKVNGTQTKGDSYKLRIEQDNALDLSNVDKNSFPTDVKITVKGDSITIELPAFNYTMGADENWATKSEYAPIHGSNNNEMTLGAGAGRYDITKDEYVYNRPAMTLTGTVTKRKEYENGRFNYEGTLNGIPAFTGTTRENFYRDIGAGGERYDLWTKAYDACKEGKFVFSYDPDHPDAAYLDFQFKTTMTSTKECHGLVEFVREHYDFYSGESTGYYIAAEPSFTKETERFDNLEEFSGWRVSLVNKTE